MDNYMSFSAELYSSSTLQSESFSYAAQSTPSNDNDDEGSAEDISEEAHQTWLAQQDQRRLLMRETCEKYGIVKSPDYGRMLVDEEHKVVLCTIPKAGCTSWKWLLARLQQDPVVHKLYLQDMEANVNPGFIHRSGYIKRYGLKILQSFSKTKRQNILRTYTKIITVRDPMVRMMSGYRDKLVPHKDGKCPFCKHLGKNIIKHYRKDGSANKSHRTVTELEFLQALVGDKSLVNINGGHWASYNSLCGPCSVQYDYISQLETANEDSGNLIKFIFNSTLRLPHHHPSNSSLKYTDFLQNITSDLKQKVLDRYLFDMEMFGYTWPQDT